MALDWAKKLTQEMRKEELKKHIKELQEQIAQKKQTIKDNEKEIEALVKEAEEAEELIRMSEEEIRLFEQVRQVPLETAAARAPQATIEDKVQEVPLLEEEEQPLEIAYRPQAYEREDIYAKPRYEGTTTIKEEDTAKKKDYEKTAVEKMQEKYEK